MRVSTLAEKLGLPKGSDQRACITEIERRKQAAETVASVERMEARLAGKSADGIAAEAMRTMSNRGMSPREIGMVFAAERISANDALGFAEELGPDRFLLEGVEYTGDQLEALMKARGEAEHAARELGREREAITATLEGEELHERALKLLASRQVW